MKSIYRVLAIVLALFLVVSVVCFSCNAKISSERIHELNNQQASMVDYSSLLERENAELDSRCAEYINTIDSLTNHKAYYVGQFKITYYDACMACCGKTNGITASGAKVSDGVTVAADTNVLPFGTRLYIEGIGFRTVQDRGGAIKGNRIDVYIQNCKGEMPYNLKNLNVWVIME